MWSATWIKWRHSVIMMKNYYIRNKQWKFFPSVNCFGIDKVLTVQRLVSSMKQHLISMMFTLQISINKSHGSLIFPSAPTIDLQTHATEKLNHCLLNIWKVMWNTLLVNTQVKTLRYLEHLQWSYFKELTLSFIHFYQLVTTIPHHTYETHIHLL